jgi:superfamily I DNA/RNA helicase
MHPIPNSRLILGPPGCGKTHTLIEIVREALAKGVHPSRIAFVSFTTKAIREALDRACAEFNLEPKQLPNFRTLHATGYHALGLQRTDVMGRDDYKALGGMLGVEFNGADRTSVDDGIVLPTIGGSGAKYLQSVMRSRYREVSLEREYNEAEDYSLSYQKLVQVHEQNEEYKTKMGKQDFVDMIALYPTMADPIYLDLLIVDEAQDLTPLQWTMVRHMSETATEVVIAGDDDQAIHRWAGVDVRQFLRCSENIEVLSQSYRLPRSVWRLAKSITAKIEDRIPKDFHPKDEEGSVQALMRLGDAPMDQGSWTIMARINSFCHDIADKLEQMGYYYSVKGVPSVSANLLQNINTWKTLSSGGTVGLRFVRDLYGAVPKMGDGALVRRGATKLLDAADPEVELSYHDLFRHYGWLGPQDMHVYEVLRVSRDEARYIRALIARGEDLNREPRINVSTFHAMKGGEDDNCIVYLGSTWACIESKYPDDELRALYVAVTRTKENLYLLESDKKHRYYL